VVSLGALIALAYVATITGPLRVDTDSAYLLELGASFADGHGLDIVGVPSFPPGYPVLVGALIRLGIAAPETFVIVALLCLVAALALWWVVCREDLTLTRNETGVVLLVSALSVYTVKYAAMPLTELPFFALSAAALALLALARSRASLLLLGAGVVAAGVACTMRSAGIALAVAVILAPASARVRGIMVGLAAAGAALVAVTAPYAMGVSRWLDDPRTTAPLETRFFVRTLGAVTANVPLSRSSETVPFWVAVVAGLAMLAVVGWTLWSRRKDLRPVDGYVVGTLAMVFIYPTEHPRFYLPILPALAGYVVIATRRLRIVGVVAATAFALIGLAALAVSIRLSHAERSFPTDYADGVLASTYRTAWGVPLPGDSTLVHQHELNAIRRFDPTPPWGDP